MWCGQIVEVLRKQITVSATKNIVARSFRRASPPGDHGYRDESEKPAHHPALRERRKWMPRLDNARQFHIMH
jgi:hypothetical protein